MANVIKKIKDEITVENVLAMALKTPGVKIKRMCFYERNWLNIAL